MIMSSVDIYLKCIGIFFIPLAVVNIYRNGIQGLGYGLLPMMAGVAELIGRGIVAVIAGKMRSYPGVCLAGPAAWVLAGGLLLVMYFYIIECTYEESFWDKWERLMRSFPFLFYRECSNENYMIKKKNQEYVDRNN